MIVGRTHELATLAHTLTTALSGQRQLVFVTGEPGIGKTTLVDAFLAPLATRSDLWLAHGQCVEQYGAGEAYLPILEAINRLCQTPRGAACLPVLHQHAPTWLLQLPSLMSEMSETDREALQRQARGSSQERMLRELAEALTVLSAEQGFVLVLEDLHWSDVSTLELLTYLARRREQTKLFIIGTYRPAERLSPEHPLKGVTQELQARGACLDFPLAPLSEQEVSSYLSQYFASTAFPGHLSHVIHQRTGGNPLFVVNTVEHLTRQGLVQQVEGQWIVSASLQTLSATVPDNLSQLIEQQLARLSDDEQEMLEVASIEGREFSVAAVAAGLQTPEDLVEERCEALSRNGSFIVATGVEEWPDHTIGGRYHFLHALYQNVLYDGIPQARRVRLHRRIGARKEAAFGERVNDIATALARHFSLGHDYTRAVAYTQRAAELARRRSAHQEAIVHCRQGLELLQKIRQTAERLEHEIQLQTSLGTSLMATKGYAAPEVEQAYARAHELCRQLGDTPKLFPVLGGLWGFYNTGGQLQIGNDLGQHILDLAQRINKSLPLHLAHTWLGQNLFYLGQFAASLQQLESAFSFYDRETHNPRVAFLPQDHGEASLAYIGWVLWLLGYPEQALRKSQDAYTLAKDIDHPFSQAHALNFAGWVHQARRETQAVHHCSKTAIVLLQDQDTPYRLAQSTILQGWARAAQGDDETGIAQMQQGIAGWSSTGAKVLYPYYLGLLAETYARAGQPEAGLDSVTQAEELVRQTGEHFYIAELERLKGELLSSPEEAEACFQRALNTARDQQAKSLELRAALSLGRLWQSQSKSDEARELLEEVYGWFSEGFGTPDLQDAETLLRSLGSRLERPSRSCSQTPPPPLLDSSTPPPTPVQVQLPDPTSLAHSTDPPEVSAHRTTQHQAQEPSPPLEGYTFQQTGDFWTVTFTGQTSRIKNLRGMSYIAHLLQHPHKEVHVLALIASDATPSQGTSRASSSQLTGDPDSLQLLSSLSDTGEVLDTQARTAYRRRLAELQNELAEAQELNDLGRSERLQEELDFLTQELATALGLGGRPRKTGSAAERARSNVTKRIKAAIKRITERHPTLGEHLSHTIRTGTFCAYTPDLRHPFQWQV